MRWLRLAKFRFDDHGLTNLTSFALWRRMENGGAFGENGFSLQSGKDARIRLMTMSMPISGLQIDLSLKLDIAPNAQFFPLAYSRDSFSIGVRNQALELHMNSNDGWKKVSVPRPPRSQEFRLRALIGAGATVAFGLDDEEPVRVTTSVGAPSAFSSSQVMIGFGAVAPQGSSTTVSGDSGTERAYIRNLSIDLGFDEKHLMSDLSTMFAGEPDANKAFANIPDLIKSSGLNENPDTLIDLPLGDASLEAVIAVLNSDEGARVSRQLMLGEATPYDIETLARKLADGIYSTDRALFSAFLAKFEKGDDAGSKYEERQGGPAAQAIMLLVQQIRANLED